LRHVAEDRFGRLPGNVAGRSRERWTELAAQIAAVTLRAVFDEGNAMKATLGKRELNP
jgi:hypothetical protein